MKFKRFPRGGQREATPRRIATSKRAIERDRDKCGLFPEMMEHTDPLKRIQALEDNFAHTWTQLRDAIAEGWRKARRDYNALPPAVRAACKRWWNESQMPADAAYLADAVWQWKKGKGLFATTLANRHRLRTGKKPNDALDCSPATPFKNIEGYFANQGARNDRRRREHREKEKARREP